MYYVIKRQYDVPMEHFIGFIIRKYIISKNKDNVIFEFDRDGKTDRKWVDKKDIILLTDDKEYFIETLNNFKATQVEELQKVTKAKEELQLSIQNLNKVMDDEILQYNNIKLQDGIPCIVKEY